jgi:hypothetical protein
MSNRINDFGLYLFCVGLTLAAGCFPQDSLDWSADGSVGLLRTGGKLYVVDGSTGAPSPIPAEKVAPWPDISADGKRVAYAGEVKHPTLAQGLKTLPTEQAKMIADDAQKLRQKVLDGTLAITDFNSVSDEQLGYVKPYREWVIRFLCENADEQLTQKLGTRVLEQGKAAELNSSVLTVVALADTGSKKIVTTSVLGIVRPCFSPDGACVAFLALGPVKDEQAHLFVASLQQDSPAVYVASNVSLSFDWRQDSQALAFAQQEDENTMLGTIREQKVRDPNGRLLYEASTHPETPLAAYRCTGENKQLAGTLFEPMMKVEYGIGGRLFFSSASGKIPSGDLDEPKYSLFCYDFVTGAVSNVLSSGTQDKSAPGQMVDFFSLSPDGRRVLLPMEKGRFAIYELATKLPNVPIQEDEEFDEDMPNMLPAWKGTDHISCQISDKSRFLTEEQQKRGRKEIVVLDAAGNFQSVLSTNWPDDAIPGESND